MAVGIIAILRVQEGKNDEFEKVFAELTEQVLSNEEGCTFYALHRSQSDPQEYKVLEQYKSMEDVAAHREMPHFKQANVKLAQLVAGPPSIEVLDGV